MNTMRRILLGILLLIGSQSLVLAQDDLAGLPPRFQAIGKEGRLRLTRILGTAELHPTFATTPTFSADGKVGVYVEDLSTGADNKPSLRSRILVWDTQKKGWPREIEVPDRNISAVALSADGMTALVGGMTISSAPKDKAVPQAYLSLWDLKAGKEVRTHLTNERPFLAIALSPDHATAIAGTHENLKRWDLKTGKETTVYGEKGKTAISALAFVPGSTQFLAGTLEGDVQLYDLANAKPVRVYKAPPRKVAEDRFIWHLAPTADGKRFAAAEFQNAVTLWNVADEKPINTLSLEKRTLEEVILGMALADDGRTIAVAWGKANPDADDFACTRLLTWDGDANKIVWSHTVPYRGRTPMHAQSGKVQVGGGPNLFDVWSMKEGKRVESWGGHKGNVNALAVLGTGDFLSAGQEGSIMTWRKNQLSGQRAAHAGGIVAMAVSRDQKQFLTAGGDQTAKLWNADDVKPHHTFKGHGGPITSLAFAGGRWAVTGSGDRTAKTWDLATGKEMGSFAGHSEGVNAVAVSPDDRWLATGSDDATIKLWPIKDGKLDADRDPVVLEKHKKAVTCLAFTPDGKRLLSAGQDQTLFVWDTAKGRMDFMIPGHKNWINSIVQLDNDIVLTSSDDLTVCAWSMATGMEVGRIDLGVVGDCPRCLAKLGPDRFAVGSSSWLIYEFRLTAEKSKTGSGSSK
jgi:WD40 repeat protein